MILKEIDSSTVPQSKLNKCKQYQINDDNDDFWLNSAAMERVNYNLNCLRSPQYELI